MIMRIDLNTGKQFTRISISGHYRKGIIWTMKYLFEEYQQLNELEVYIGVKASPDEIDAMDKTIYKNFAQSFDSGYGGGIRDYWIKAHDREHAWYIEDNAAKVFKDRLHKVEIQ